MVRPSHLVIVDDHPVIATGLLGAFRDGGFFVSGTATSTAQAIRTISATRPDIVVVDPFRDGAFRDDLVADCRAAAPEAVIIVFTAGPLSEAASSRSGPVRTRCSKRRPRPSTS